MNCGCSKDEICSHCHTELLSPMYDFIKINTVLGTKSYIGLKWNLIDAIVNTKEEAINLFWNSSFESGPFFRQLDLIANIRVKEWL